MAEATDTFDEWFRAEHPRVLSAALIVSAGDVAKAEDATNDAFVKAFERWDSVGSMASPRAWVTKIAINGAKRAFMRRRRHVPLTNDDNALLSTVDPEIDIGPETVAATLSQARRKLRIELEGEAS